MVLLNYSDAKLTKDLILSYHIQRNMSILKIPVFSQNPIIRKKAKEVAGIKNPEIQRLIFNMKETMKASQGLGLAAPQVGKGLRIFVVDSTAFGGQPQNQVYINPKIKRKSFAKSIEEEGCLSVPGIYKQIKRSKDLMVEALDENGKKFRLKAAGLLARVIQHECDHLNGILITDK